MNRLFRITILAAFILLAGACTRHTIIPDRELAQIFRDAFVANAYVGERQILLDSLNVYEPIFASYGYTTSDVQYTIGNFSKRKSARLGDVVEEAIQMLDNQGAYYDRQVAILDTIDHVAMRTLTKRIAADTLIRIRSLRDTSRANFSFEVKPGEYNIRMKYLIDSLDRNERSVRASVWLEKNDSTRTGYYTTTLRRDYEETFIRRIVVDTTHRRLHIKLLGFTDKPRQPSVWFRNFTVDYTPPTREAVKSLYEQQLDIRIFADEFFRAAHPMDSL